MSAQDVERNIDDHEVNYATNSNLSTAEARDKLVATAIKFLQNNNVVNSSLKEKQEFLQRKGLTDEEITDALLEAQREMDALRQVAAPTSQRSRLRDWAFFLTMFGGAAYVFYRFYKEFLMPFLTGEDQKAADLLQKALTQQSESLSQLSTKLEGLQQTCDTNSQKIDQLQTSTNTGASREVKELKDELSSLKRLLLNRHQFPDNPVSKPIIPTWQLEMEQSIEADTKEEASTDSPVSALSSHSESVNGDDNIGSGVNGHTAMSSNGAEDNDESLSVSGVEIKQVSSSSDFILDSKPSVDSHTNTTSTSHSPDIIQSAG